MREKVIGLLKKEIELEHIPGAVISVSCQGKMILEEAVGSRTIAPVPKPMTVDTVFDLASLTKVVATVPAILKLVDDGEIRLDDRVSLFLPNFGKHGKEKITLKDLLTHTSGLPAHKAYYVEKLGSEQIFEAIYGEELECPAGNKVIYSDLGFIILYNVIEAVAGEPFDQFVDREIFQPLGMLHTGFNPSFSRERYAETEYNERLNVYKQGIVHDENAEAMGGISGHAGLFSTIHDLQNFASMIESDGVFRGKRVLSEAAVRLSRKNFSPFDREHRGLGWALKGQEMASCGDLFSERSYGHTGFTGTSIWFDPEVKLHVILLTNRVHLGRGPAIIRLRPRLHNIIRASI